MQAAHRDLRLVNSMFNTYQQALTYLYQNLPMFQRVGAIAYKADLSNTLALCEALGNPQKTFKSIHIAGTNGKGSTSHMLASVLQSAGYKTGLYTSPHLKEFTERIRVNGNEITQSFVVDFVNRIKPQIDIIQPSFFEITVAMAFDYFRDQQVDIAVIEVGLGGRLDATNVITPILSVITNIGYDHKDILGDTLPQIAFEKAGIIKDHIPVVISERQSEVENVFIEKARAHRADIMFASDQYSVSVAKGLFRVEKNGSLQIRDLKLPLKGFYQKKNLAGVCKVFDVLEQLGVMIPYTALIHGLENVVVQTGLKGRWQQLNDKPLIICDTGHNADGIRELVAQIKQQSYKKLYMIIGMVKDKEPDAVLKILPTDAYYYFCQASIPRALEATQLRDHANRFQLEGEVEPDVNEAIRKAKAKADANDFIFIGGSTFVVAEIDAL